MIYRRERKDILTRLFEYVSYGSYMVVVFATSYGFTSVVLRATDLTV